MCIYPIGCSILARLIFYLVDYQSLQKTSFILRSSLSLKHSFRSISHYSLNYVSPPDVPLLALHCLLASTLADLHLYHPASLQHTSIVHHPLIYDGCLPANMSDPPNVQLPCIKPSPAD
jgi:hypothetical protein